MPYIKLDSDNNTTVGTTSEEATFVGHGTVSVASTTQDQVFDGVYAVDVFIGGHWIESQELTGPGVFPGFNAVTAKYRLRLKQAPAAGKTGEARMVGWDRPTNLPY